VRDLNDEKIRILWNHDLPEDPESKKTRDETYRNKFHKFVFVSNWQYSRYQLVNGFPYSEKSIVIEHGVEPSPISCLDKPKDKIRLVYTSTPQRGLELLVPVFEHLAKKHPEIHLDVFSSFKIYGWEGADTAFEPIYEKIRNHPQMTYHGFQPNEVVREHLNTAHIFAYPSIWMETSCIAMIEAMSSGLVCVHPNYAALSDTSGGLNIMYQGNENDKNAHANIFSKYLDAAIKLVKENQETEMIHFNKMYVDNRFSIKRSVAKWNQLLNALKEDFPTEESRKSKEFLTYRTT
jgi:glycosyltransferase involved in cell wall biosynthesis